MSLCVCVCERACVCVQRGHMRHSEGVAVSNQRESSPGNIPGTLALHPPELWKVHACCLSHPTHGSLPRQPKETTQQSLSEVRFSRQNFVHLEPIKWPRPPQMCCITFLVHFQTPHKLDTLPYQFPLLGSHKSKMNPHEQDTRMLCSLCNMATLRHSGFTQPHKFRPLLPWMVFALLQLTAMDSYCLSSEREDLYVF